MKRVYFTYEALPPIFYKFVNYICDNKVHHYCDCCVTIVCVYYIIIRIYLILTTTVLCLFISYMCIISPYFWFTVLVFTLFLVVFFLS